MEAPTTPRYFETISFDVSFTTSLTVECSGKQNQEVLLKDAVVEWLVSLSQLQKIRGPIQIETVSISFIEIKGYPNTIKEIIKW